MRNSVNMAETREGANRKLNYNQAGNLSREKSYDHIEKINDLMDSNKKQKTTEYLSRNNNFLDEISLPKSRSN